MGATKVMEQVLRLARLGLQRANCWPTHSKTLSGQPPPLFSCLSSAVNVHQQSLCLSSATSMSQFSHQSRPSRDSASPIDQPLSQAVLPDSSG
ncbi:hypothetical protein HN51_004254 [Arachis hypogaea]